MNTHGPSVCRGALSARVQSWAQFNMDIRNTTQYTHRCTRARPSRLGSLSTPLSNATSPYPTPPHSSAISSSPSNHHHHHHHHHHTRQILSWYPRIVVFPGFIDKARAEHIVKLAGKFMYPSGLAYRWAGAEREGERERGRERGRGKG